MTTRAFRGPILRALRVGLGATLVVVGAVVTPTPIPVGLLMLSTGLVILARDIPGLRGRILAACRRWPALEQLVKRMLAGSEDPGPTRRDRPD